MKAAPKGGTAFEAFKVRLRRRIFCAVVPLTEDDIITMRDKFGAREVCPTIINRLPKFGISSGEFCACELIASPCEG